MTLSVLSLKARLREAGTLTETALAHEFATTPAVIAMMAEKLAQKGLVELNVVTTTCKSCCCGKTEPVRRWRWKGEAAK